MADFFAATINSYLQTRSSCVNPRIINRSVNKARDVPLVYDSSCWEAPLYRLSSQQPTLPTENCDPVTRPVGFGSWAIPKLRHELHDIDPLTVIQSLHSLCDLVRDPEKGYEAVNLRIPDRLVDLLFDDLHPIREGAALLLSILAELESGREAIINNAQILENLILCLGDAQISVRLKVASCFEMLSRSWRAADVLVEAELVQTLLEILDKEEMPEIVEFHLKTLKAIMYECGKCVAMKNNGFRIFMKYLEENHTEALNCGALDCLAQLTSTRLGKKLAVKEHLMKTVIKFLYYGNLDTITKALNLLMFCTVKTRAKHLALEFKCLPKRLIKLATNPIPASLQMFALKVLTNICEHPEIRKELRETYSKELNNMQVSPVNAEYRKILLSLVSWRPEQLI